MSSSRWVVTAGAATDAGRVREENEDTAMADGSANSSHGVGAGW